MSKLKFELTFKRLRKRENADNFFDPRTDTKDVPAHKKNCWDTLFAVMRIGAIPEFNGCSSGGTSPQTVSLDT
jgi:hypothetical protein